LLLTEDEASVLSSSIENLLPSNEPCNHSHINDEKFNREITVAIYNSKNIDDFHVDIQELIKDDNCSIWQNKSQ
jgi:hypothetical protein